MRQIRITKFYRQSPHGGNFGNDMLAQLLIKWLCMTAAVLFAAYVLDGIYVKDFFSAFFTAAALGILNMIFRPLLLILTLPINVLSLGLFTFVINAFMLELASGLVPGFTVTGFWTAVFGSLLISIASWALSALFKEHRMYGYSHRQADNEDDDTIDLDKKNGKWG